MAALNGFLEWTRKRKIFCESSAVAVVTILTSRTRSETFRIADSFHFYVLIFMKLTSGSCPSSPWVCKYIPLPSGGLDVHQLIIVLRADTKAAEEFGQQVISSNHGNDRFYKTILVGFAGAQSSAKYANLQWLQQCGKSKLFPRSEKRLKLHFIYCM